MPIDADSESDAFEAARMAEARQRQRRQGRSSLLGRGMGGHDPHLRRPCAAEHRRRHLLRRHCPVHCPASRHSDGLPARLPVAAPGHVSGLGLGSLVHEGGHGSSARPRNPGTCAVSAAAGGCRCQPTGRSPAAVAQELIYDGFMLDARVVVTYFAMCGLFIYALARLRSANPKMVLLQLFGTIVIDVFLLTGPISTKFNSTLAQVFVKPGAIGIGLGAVCCLFVFPQSTSYVVLGQVEQLIRLLDAPVDSTRRYFAGDKTLDDAQLRASKDAIIGSFKAMEPALAFLPLDLSRGRWNADDVKTLQGRVRDATAAAILLLDFHSARASAAARAERLGTVRPTLDPQRADDGSGKEGSDLDKASLDADVVDALKSPEQSSIRPGLLDTLRDATAEILDVNSRAIQAAADTVHTINTGRWYFGTARTNRLDGLKQELAELRAKLQSVRESCVVKINDAVVGAHADLFDDQGQLKDRKDTNPLSLNGIVLSMVLEERILGTAATTEAMLEHILELLELRTTTRVWIPSRLRYALSWLLSRSVPFPGAGASTVPAEDPDDASAQAEETHRRLRLVSRGTASPRKQRPFPTRALVGTYKWFTNPGGMYALRMVIVTIALSVPAVLPSTAGFFYREKGIWAVITAQTCLLMYMADFTFSLVSRGLGTILGGALALAAWYAGSGNGIGNPYGLGATTAVASSILMWWRLYLPPAFAQASIMTASTFVLIIGFSWDQNHIAQYGLPGVGYVAFWRRLVTVLIGFAAALVVQVFPRPPSATRYVCKTLANTVRSLSDHYALLISQWSRADGERRNLDPGAAATAAAENITLKVAETLVHLTAAIRLLKVEVSSTPFDHKVLLATREHCSRMNQCLGKLLVLSCTLPKHLQARLAGTVGMLDDGVVGNVMSVLAIVESSLRTGAPLPERLPAPLVHSCFVAWYARHERAELTVDLVRSAEYRRYCVAVSSYVTLLSTIDDAVEALKATLGEAHVVHDWGEAA
ncbi:uncharacterized protein MAM_03599 [Metarhizium album ARSEF 1941]|uniref:DUF2421 domain-containing protein n=1 Tax=Metarhizium album (strain ARSEF 1941) TaxID=1081103 RepID=A0A0B2X061_METAS|nr:uncharacterized protein MAM_03599 [Metarhizium album ARSEF 1941]KHN98475.1 hypothetical protein MAM_03599 [Metarhizium album ARSEF 1941]